MMSFVALLIMLGLSGFGVHAVARRAGLAAASAPLGVIAVGCGLLLLGLFDEKRFASFMQEDSWVEWATFFAFGAAGVRSLLTARSTWESNSKNSSEAGSPAALDRRLAAIGFTLIGAFALFVAGEEISWGQRLFAFQPPEIFLQENYQQELNLHNFLKGKEVGALSLDSRYLVVLIAFGYGLVLPLLGRVLSQSWGRAARTVAPSWAYFGLFGVVVLAELTYPFEYTGEAAELILGLVFLLVAAEQSGLLETSDSVENEAPAGERATGLAEILPGLRGPALVGVPLLLGVAWSGAVGALAYGSSEELSVITQGELTQLMTDLAEGGIVTDKLRRKRSVHKRLFTAVRAGYFELGTASSFLEGEPTPAEPDARSASPARRDRKGYFLDPWNNPYWVSYERRGARIVVYSFGANRRRDTDFDARTLRAGGDDLIAVISVDRRAQVASR